MIELNERKQHVLLAARRLFLEKGFAHTSIQNILDEAGISKGTFYNYFTSKNECLMAIIQQSWEESAVLRDEIASDRSDGPGVLAEQIIIRLRLNRDQNLLPLYEAILHSGDAELREFMGSIRLSEFAWTERRIVEVYGEWTRPYAADAAVLQFGMLIQFLQLQSAMKAPVDYPGLVDYILRRMEAILADLAEHNEYMLQPGRFVSEVVGPVRISPARLAEQIRQLAGTLPEQHRETGEEYAGFLSSELQSGQPRHLLVRTVAGPFRKLFEGTPAESEARTAMADLWQITKPQPDQPDEAN